jgi:cell division protein FtsI/penicillin-binding protein 2
VERIQAIVMQISIRARVVMIVAALGLASTALIARLVTLQVLESERLRDQARRQHEQVIEVGGRRGSIVDRDGREFAVSIATQSLYAHPSRVKDPDRLARLLAPYLARPVSELRALLRSDEPFVWLRRRVDPATARAIAKLDPQIGKGGPIAFQEEPKRFYPQGSLAVHVVGFADLDQRGLEGIEKKFDDVLQGDSTRYLAVRDARGTMLLQPLRPPAKRSHDVVLTIDLVLQHIVERELDRAMTETGAKAASAVLVDPKTGQVLALANRPTIEPIAYGKGAPEARRNRAIEYAFEPGSTFKVVSASAALEQGTVTPEQRFNCTSFTVAGKSYTDVHKYGTLSVREILEHSSNVGMVQVGRTVSREQLRGTIVGFGFGRKTGIELPAERNGNITSLARMSATSPAAMSIGYEVDVTALQVAQAYATIANDGVLVPTRIVLGTRDDEGRFVPEEAPQPRRVVSTRTAGAMTSMMEGVVLHGTGQNAQISGYHIAGKTGTAKKFLPGGGGYTDDEYYASFGGFGPLRDPHLVGFVVLDTPRGGIYYGGQVAAPVFERIVADGLAYLRVPPDDDPWEARRDELKAKAEILRKARSARHKKAPHRADDATESAPTMLVTTRGQIPDLRGKAVREAVAGLVARGYRARLDGQGVVVRQTPAAGTVVAVGQACTLHLGDPETIVEDERRARAVAKAGGADTLVAETRPRATSRRGARKRP